MYASEGLKSKDIISGAGKAAEGLLVTVPGAGTKEFLANYKAEYNADTGPFAAQSYDAMMVIGQVIKAGATTGEQIKTKLYSLDYSGATGKVKFDNKGDVTGGFDLWKIKDGNYVRVK